MGSMSPLSRIVFGLACLLVAYPQALWANPELLRVPDSDSFSKFVNEIVKFPSIGLEVTAASQAIDPMAPAQSDQGKIELRNLSDGQLYTCQGCPTPRYYGLSGDNAGEALAKGDNAELLVGVPGRDRFIVIDNLFVTFLTTPSLGNPFVSTTPGVQTFPYPGAAAGPKEFGEEIVVFQQTVGQTPTTHAAVAAPGTNEVFIYSKNMTNGIWSLKFQINGPDQTTTEFGRAMAVGDVDGIGGENDLIIGAHQDTALVTAPGSGAVYVYLNVGASSTAPTAPSATLAGSQSNEDFGYSLAYINSGSANRYLMVGAPKYDRGVYADAGAGHLYRVTGSSNIGFTFIKDIGTFWNGALAGDKVALIEVDATTSPPTVDAITGAISSGINGSLIGERISGVQSDIGRLTHFIQPMIGGEVGRFISDYVDQNNDGIADIVYGEHTLQTMPFMPNDNSLVVSKGLAPVSGNINGSVTPYIPQAPDQSGCLLTPFQNLNMTIPTLQIAGTTANPSGRPITLKPFRLGVVGLKASSTSPHALQQIVNTNGEEARLGLFCGDTHQTTYPALQNCRWPNGAQWYQWEKVLSNNSFDPQTGDLREQFLLTPNMPPALIGTEWICSAHITRWVNGALTDVLGFTTSVKVEIGNQ